MQKLFKFIIKDGFESMNFSEAAAMLSQAYWCKGISREEVEKGAKNSALVLGAFLPEGTQIAYARVISDKTRFAYILDVYVDEKHRKKGIGQSMMKYILNHKELSDVYQWMLITKDAHEVYKKVGFKPLGRPEDWLEIRHDRPVR